MKRIICVFLTIVLFAALSAYGFAESEERLSADELLAKGQQYENGDGVVQDYATVPAETEKQRGYRDGDAIQKAWKNKPDG